MTERPYRAAIVGCGDIAHAHAQGYLGCPGVELVAVADPVEAARRQVQEEYGVPGAYASLGELLAAETPDILSVCVWHLLHAPMTVAAAESGVRAVICEKPMAVGLAEADRMIAACEANGTKLVVSHQRRFTPGWEEARRVIASGAIGQVQLARARTAAGLLNVGTHVLDAMLFILGDPTVAWVMGAVERRTDRFERDIPIEDGCLLLAQLDGGTQLLVETDLPVDPAPSGLLIRFEGTDGVLESTEGWVRVLDGHGGGWRELLDARPVDTIGGRANIRQVAELLAWMEGGPPHRGAAPLARCTTEIMMAAYESARRHQLVRLPLTEPAYPLALMIEEGKFGPTEGPAYDIRAFLRRDGVDERRYAQLRAEGVGHQQIMRRLADERAGEAAG